jgi:hypothetical protein
LTKEIGTNETGTIHFPFYIPVPIKNDDTLIF